MFRWYWLAALLAACTPDDAGPDADPDGPGGSTAAACGRYAAVRVGRRWVWDWDDGGTTGTWSTTVVALDGDVGTLRTDAAYRGDAYDMSQTTMSDFHCDDGFVTDAATSTWSGTSAGTPFAGTSTTTYTLGGPQLPMTLQRGDTWTVRYAGDTVSEPGGASSFDFSTAYEAIDEASVTVPAGTYTAWRLDSETDTGVVGASWVVADVGTVKATGIVLVSMTD